MCGCHSQGQRFSGWTRSLYNFCLQTWLESVKSLAFPGTMNQEPIKRQYYDKPPTPTTSTVSTSETQ